MAITNTLTAIKDYFMDWHTKNYQILHKIPLESPLNAISNDPKDDNKLVTNKAVRDKINNSTIDIPNAAITVNGRTKTIQTTLNDFDSTLTDINNNYVRKTDLAYYPPLQNDLYTSIDPDNRGLVPLLDTTQCHDGLMTWKEKLDVQYYGTWKEVTGKAIGGNAKGMTLWVNPGLRLVFFHFKYDNCPYLRDNYKDFEDNNWFDYPGTSNYDLWEQITPIKDVWAPTNHISVMMGVGADGAFRLRSSKAITKKISINATLMWFYRDGKLSSKVNKI